MCIGRIYEQSCRCSDMVFLILSPFTPWILSSKNSQAVDYGSWSDSNSVTGVLCGFQSWKTQYISLIAPDLFQFSWASKNNHHVQVCLISVTEKLHFYFNYIFKYCVYAVEHKQLKLTERLSHTDVISMHTQTQSNQKSWRVLLKAAAAAAFFCLCLAHYMQQWILQIP